MSLQPKTTRCFSILVLKYNISAFLKFRTQNIGFTENNWSQNIRLTSLYIKVLSAQLTWSKNQLFCSKIIKLNKVSVKMCLHIDSAHDFSPKPVIFIHLCRIVHFDDKHNLRWIKILPCLFSFIVWNTMEVY